MVRFALLVIAVSLATSTATFAEHRVISIGDRRISIYCVLGFRSYRLIGIGWLLHAAWDFLHHLYGNPLPLFAPTSSLGCGIWDPLVALWFLAGAPSVSRRFREPVKRRSGMC